MILIAANSDQSANHRPVAALNRRAPDKNGRDRVVIIVDGKGHVRLIISDRQQDAGKRAQDTGAEVSAEDDGCDWQAHGLCGRQSAPD